MELPSILLEQIAFITRPKIKERILIIMDKSTHEVHLSQPLQTYNKHFTLAVTFLTGCNGIFNVTVSNNKFNFKKTIKDEDFIKVTIPPGAYEIEAINNEIRRIFTDKAYYTETNYLFRIKSNFSTLGSFVEILTPGPMSSFVFDDIIGIPLGFDEILLWAKYNLSPNPVDFLSFDSIFLECDIARGMIYEGRRSGIIHNWTMTVEPGYKYVESFITGITGGNIWYILESKEVFSNICFKLKTESNQIVSFNGHSKAFRSSIKEI